MTTSPVLEQLHRIRPFVERQNPFHDHRMLDIVLEDEEFQAYLQDWKTERAFFEQHTGEPYPRLDCLKGWVAEHEIALELLPQSERIDLMVWAAGTYQKTLAEVLLRADPDLLTQFNQEGEWPLHSAASAQAKTIFSWLLSKHWNQANVLQQVDGQGQTVVQRVLMARDQGAEVRWPTRFGGADHKACLREIIEVAPHLLCQPFPDGNTALHLAAALAQPMGVCKLIVGAGGQWHHPNAEGITPAEVLASNPHFKPSPTSKNPERRREHRFRETVLASAAAPALSPTLAPETAPAPPKASRWGKLFGFPR